MMRLPAILCTSLVLAGCGRSGLLARHLDGSRGEGAQAGQGGAVGAGGTTVRTGADAPGATGGAGGTASTTSATCTPCAGTCADTQTDDRNCGGCGVVCATVPPSTSRCTGGRCLVTLAAAQKEPGSLAVDGDSLYWTTLPHGKGTVMKVPRQGGAPTVLASDQAGPKHVIVDATDVYWALDSLGVATTSRQGGPITTLVSGITYFTTFAVDATSLYWLLAAGSSSVVKMPREGGARTTLATMNRGSGRSLALDATDVYWADDGPPDGESAVYKVPREGGPVTTLAKDQGIAGGLTVDATSIYWTAWRIETEGVLMRMPKSGGPPSAVVAGPNSGNFAVDEANVYWTDNVAGVVMKAPLAGGMPTTLAAGEPGPNSIVVDATSLYWSNYGSYPIGATDGAVMKLSPK